jgi:hypothetical protein
VDTRTERVGSACDASTRAPFQVCSREVAPLASVRAPITRASAEQTHDVTTAVISDSSARVGLCPLASACGASDSRSDRYAIERPPMPLARPQGAEPRRDALHRRLCIGCGYARQAWSPRTSERIIHGAVPFASRRWCARMPADTM